MNILVNDIYPENPYDHFVDDVYMEKWGLIVGDLRSSIAVCALWKDLSNVVIDPISLNRFALLGNLYTMRGISQMLRGLWRLPSVRHVVLYGPDTQHTGNMVQKLWQSGIDENNQIPGTSVRIDPALPADLVNHLCQKVHLHDLRDVEDFSTMLLRLEDFVPLPPHGTARLFPNPEPEVPETIPSSGTGFMVQGDKSAHVWLQAIDLVMRFGGEKASEHNDSQRELLNVMSTIHTEDPNHPYLPKGIAEVLNISPTEQTAYNQSMIFDDDLQGRAYTPGNRLKVYFQRDQIETVINKLHKAPHTRRAVLSLWDPVKDPDRVSPPCLTEIQLHEANNQLHMRYTARSQDMFKAWLQDTFALRSLQCYIADELDLPLGPLTVVTGSAHIYKQDWGKALETTNKFRNMLTALRFDPNGDFIISVECNEIVVQLIDRSGGNVVWRTHGSSSKELGYQIAHLQLTSIPSHLAYVVGELAHAEEALRRGEKYIQDCA